MCPACGNRQVVVVFELRKWEVVDDEVTPLCKRISQFTAILLRVPYVFASGFSAAIRCDGLTNRVFNVSLLFSMVHSCNHLS